MRERARLTVFAVGAAALAALLAWGVLGLPPAGEYRGPYGDVVARACVPERHATDVVSAINFDIRGIDTVGEEFILFASVVGVALLLRASRDEDEEDGGPPPQAFRGVPPASDALRLGVLGFVGVEVVFGAYVVTHGQLTPGGGFQGGVLLATAPLLVYLAGNAGKFLRVAPEWLVEVLEAAGALGFLAIGLASLAAGAAFLQDVLPLGNPDGDVLSGGTLPLVSLATGVEVAAGFVLLLVTFVEQTLRRQTPGRGLG